MTVARPPAGLFVGLATLDVVQRVDRLPGRNEKTTAVQTWLAAGGPAAVAAITYAALGGRARLWTSLGSGAAAHAVRADLDNAGVEIIDAAPPGFEVAVSTGFLNSASGERAVVSGSGHRPSLPEQPEPDLSGFGVVLIDGHNPELARSAVAAGSARAIDVVVDAGSYKPVFGEVLGRVTDLLCSADYRHPGGLGAADLAQLGPALVAISHGGEPVQWWTAVANGQLTVPRVKVVDTLGAGDVWHGGYCFALASGADRMEALAFASRVAAIRVQHLGPFSWRPAALIARRGPVRFRPLRAPCGRLWPWQQRSGSRRGRRSTPPPRRPDRR